MLWLSRRPEWQRSREFETTTRTAGPGGAASAHYSAEDADWDQWEVAESSSLAHDPDAEGRPKTRVVFQPTYDTTHTIFYRGHWLRVRRGRKQETGSEMLSIRSVARSPPPLLPSFHFRRRHTFSPPLSLLLSFLPPLCIVVSSRAIMRS
jgi:chaperone BCS1